MKISAMNTKDGFALMQKLVPVTAKILEDADIGNAKALLTNRESGAELAAKVTPILLKNHMEDVIGLVAIMQGSTPEEVAAQPIGSTVETLSEGIKLFAAFFTASLHLVASA